MSGVMASLIDPSTGNIVLQPQEGPQFEFLASPADIVVGGGGAGGGKTWALLLGPLRWIEDPQFGAVIFRREYPQITNEGGLWDKSWEIYPLFGAKAREATLDWTFPSGARIKFAHMQREEDRYNWDGSEIPLIEFDQLESFTWRQFTYMFSRNRSMCSVDPHIRCTCNPHPRHFLRKFLEWWIDDETGIAIPSRSGVIRFFVIIDDKVEWGATPEALKHEFGDDAIPKSATFIPSNVYHNRILLKSNPSYLATLKALQKVDRERLLNGNWNATEKAGMYFERTWFPMVDAAPIDGGMTIRYWDRASTPEPKNMGGELDPAKHSGKRKRSSATAGVKMMLMPNGRIYIVDMIKFRKGPLDVEEAIKNTASQDGFQVEIGIEQDPGQAGVAEAQYQIRNLAGYCAYANPVHESKAVRVKPFSAQCEAHNVYIVRGAWNDDFFDELEAYDGTEGCQADQVDACSGAFMMLTGYRRAGVWGNR